MNKTPRGRSATKTEQIRVRTTPQILAMLEEAATKLGLNRSDYINHILTIWVSNGCRFPVNYSHRENTPTLRVADAPSQIAP